MNITNGQFAKPNDITFDVVGGVYVTDTNIHHIQKFGDKRAGRCSLKVL